MRLGPHSTAVPPERHRSPLPVAQGSAARDLCVSWWCGPCALAQETREVVIQAQKAAAGGAS